MKKIVLPAMSGLKNIIYFTAKEKQVILLIVLKEYSDYISTQWKH